MTRRASPRGFTLVELLVVVAIIAIISAIMFGLNSQTYGTSSMNVSDELTSSFNLCKMRAVSTRRWHRCEVTPTTLTIMQWQSTGMSVPGIGTWSVVQIATVGNGVSIWGATATPCAEGPCAGAPAVANAGLLFDIDFRPDGSSTGGTVFVTDSAQNIMYRVVVYKATGSSYARNSW
jgi:prepilin-type N-terminal cleavage/methylation domain-containing protein